MSKQARIPLIVALIIFPMIYLSSTVDCEAFQISKGKAWLDADMIGEKERIPLRGEWEFYWGKYLESKDFSANPKPGEIEYAIVPSSWGEKRINNKKLPQKGFATYRFVLESEQDTRLGLYMPWFWSSYKLWVNNELVAQNGVLGKSVSDSVPQFLPKEFSHDFVQGDNEFILQISNFHLTHGGFRRNILIGSPEAIASWWDMINVFYGIVSGSFFIFALYHFILFFLRREDKSSLYFATVCLMGLLSSLVTGNLILVQFFPDIHYELELKIEYLTVYATLPFFCLFLNSVFSGLLNRYIYRFILIISFALTIATLIFPCSIYTIPAVPYQILTIVSLLYITIMILVRSFRGDKEAMIGVPGIFLIYLAIVHDYIVFQERFENIFLTHVALWIFLFSQSVILSYRFADTYKKKLSLAKMLKRTSTRLVRAHEDERNRISRELHDSLGQSLLAIKLNLQMINGQLDHKESEASNYHSIISEIDNTIEEVRSISRDLRPSFLEDAELEEIIAYHADQLERKTQLKLILVNNAGKINLSLLQKEQIFRIYQEALNNIIKHTDCECFEVFITKDSNKLRITIKDDGPGFDDSANEPNKSGLGLISMRERAEIIDGKLIISSQRNVGTEVTIELPDGD